LGGFLGSGKTTVLLQLAEELVREGAGSSDVPVMIIENEIGEVGIDDKVLKNRGLQVKELFAGCACCTSGGSLIEDVHTIARDVRPTWLIIEATGVAYPKEIRNNLVNNCNEPVKIIAIADAARWQRLWNAMSQLLLAQLDGADIVLINKCDLAEPKVADDIATLIQTFNSAAEIRKISAASRLDGEVWSAILG
jgi:G3E family GTPase